MRSRFAVALVALAGLTSAGPAAAGSYVYVHDGGNGSVAMPQQIFGFALAPSGELTPLPDSPFPLLGGDIVCSGFCQTLDYSRKRKLLVAGGARE